MISYFDCFFFIGRKWLDSHVTRQRC